MCIDPLHNCPPQSPTGRTSSSPLARAAPPIIAATTAISPSALAEVKSQLEMSTRDNTMLNAELDTLTKQKASLVVDMERQAKELKALQKEHEALRAEMAFNKQEKSLNREAENKYSTRVAELEEEVFQLKKVCA